MMGLQNVCLRSRDRDCRVDDLVSQGVGNRGLSKGLMGKHGESNKSLLYTSQDRT